MSKKMTVKQSIYKMVKRNKTGLTAESLCKRLNLKEKHLRNRVGEMVADGQLSVYEYYKQSSSGRNVLSYVAQ